MQDRHDREEKREGGLTPNEPQVKGGKPMASRKMIMILVAIPVAAVAVVLTLLHGCRGPIVCDPAHERKICDPVHEPSPDKEK